MSIQINTQDWIILNSKDVGLGVRQTSAKTVVYRREQPLSGIKYTEYSMPSIRYSLSHPHPASGAAGCSQFESDVRDLLAGLQS